MPVEVPDARADPASFRDRRGFVFHYRGTPYRYVHDRGGADYDCLMESGLYDRLVAEGWLVPHREADPESLDLDPLDVPEPHRILRPREIPFVSYPYEWCFDQLKDAALLTLRIQKAALDHGMILEDGSAYNLQFHGARPIFVDTLSFTRWEEGQLWTGYRQFCRHFLAPLAVMKYCDLRLNGLFKSFLDGLPLDAASAMLPVRSWFRLHLMVHLHLQNLSRRFLGRRDEASTNASEHSGLFSLRGLIDSLQSAVSGLSKPSRSGSWGSYYEELPYSQRAFERKKKQVLEYVGRVEPETVWDLGANTGLISRSVAEGECLVVAMDSSPESVQENYRRADEVRDGTVLPLVMDLANPSPAVGWELEERRSLMDRGPADLTLALALVHHLAIAHNVPLGKIADFLKAISRWVVVEFVPKEDPKVRQMLTRREDIFEDYSREAFEAAFTDRFTLRSQQSLPDSARVLYLMENESPR